MGDTPQHTTRTAGTGGRKPPQLARADALRRLSRLKKGTTVAAVLGFGALSGTIAVQPRGTATKATAMAVPLTTTPSATTIPSATPSATATPSPAATASASTAARSAKAAPAATKAARSATPPPTSTPSATATPPATATSPATATPTPQNGFFSQGQGGTNVGSASSAQAPVAGSGAS